MQGGDWNDGMNRVGIDGRGESVWLGWFLYATLRDFAPIAARRGDADARARRGCATPSRCSARSTATRGTAHGSGARTSTMARRSARRTTANAGSIRSRKAGRRSPAPPNPDRARQAMDAVSEYLVKRGDDMVLLFTPPFNASVPDPGYIQGYLPGVRENGAQYTHAAAWCVIAYAMLGDGDRAFELFAMLNPINHASTRGGAHRYKIEPYVVPGDVYSEPPHVGRGGWSWYTGAAGWLYRAGIEYMLGVRVQGAHVQVVAVHPARLVRLHGALPPRRRDVRHPRGESLAHFDRRGRHRRRWQARYGRPIRRRRRRSRASRRRALARTGRHARQACASRARSAGRRASGVERWDD